MHQYIPQYFPTSPSCLWHSILSPVPPTEDKIFKNKSQLYSFTRRYSHRSTQCICWELFSTADWYAPDALANIYSSRLCMCDGNKLQRPGSPWWRQTSPRTAVWRVGVFLMDLFGIEIRAMSGFGYMGRINALLLYQRIIIFNYYA